MAEKSGRMSALEQGGGVTDEEKLPPTSSKAGFVRPMRSACPTTSDTPPASHIFSPPLAAPVNLRTGIYDTALAPLVDIPISMQEKRKARRKSEDLRYQLQKQLIHGTSLKSTCWTIGI